MTSRGTWPSGKKNLAKKQNPQKCLKEQALVYPSLGLPRTRLTGQGPGLLDLDLEQLLKSGQAPACVLLQAQEQPGENRLLFPIPSHARDLTQGPVFTRSPGLVFYFPGPSDPVLAAHHLCAPPACRELRAGGRWSTASGLADPADPPARAPRPFCEVLVSLPTRRATMFCIYMLVLHSRRLALL